MLGRGSLFKRPDNDSSDEEDVMGGREVVTKAVHTNIARKLDAFYQPRQFVTGSSKSQMELHGEGTPKVESNDAPSLTGDERNKLSAQIMKAEMMGDEAKAERLRKRLADGVSTEGTSTSGGGGDLLLTRTDHRTGVTRPVDSGVKPTDRHSDASTSIRAMVEEERSTTADEGLAMLGELASKAISGVRQDDDNTLDEIFEGRGKRKHKKHREKEEKDERRRRKKAVQDHKRYEHTLSTCRWCLDGGAAQKHLVVARGIQTYLCLPPHSPLVDGHLYIVPQTHVYSSVQLDEDVYAEMRLWRRGLVAFYAARDEDCVFMETALGVRQQRHMIVESIPLPMEVGDTAPIYFKKAIDEHGSEWATNKKLIKLHEKDIRHSVPKGFPYFAVDFGNQPGYAHIIEDEKQFPSTFGHSIVGGMLDLDINSWRRPRTLDGGEVNERVLKMKEEWRPFDWTERARLALADE